MLTPSQKKYQTMTKDDRLLAKARQDLTRDAIARGFCVVPGCSATPLRRDESATRYGLGRCGAHQGISWAEIDAKYGGL